VEAAAEARHQQRHPEHQRGRQHRDDEPSPPPLEIAKRHPPHAAPLSFRECLMVVGGIRPTGGKEAHRRIDRGATTPAGIVAATFPARAAAGTMAAGFRRGAGMR
jgi:hypothetical protein